MIYIYLWPRSNKYKIFHFKTKGLVKKYVLFNTKSLEEFSCMLEIIKYSFTDSNMVSKNIFSRN